MSEPLVMSIPHRLGKDEALRRLKTGLAEVGTRFGHLFSVREQTWTGDHLRFQVSALGQSASGSIDVAEDYVRLEVLLPWLLARLVGTIQPLIRKEGTLRLRRNDAVILRCTASVQQSLRPSLTLGSLARYSFPTSFNVYRYLAQSPLHVR
jgi:hypothetical protein